MSLSSNISRARIAARSLYRNLLRETRKLPYDYLRQFFRVKFRDDFGVGSKETRLRNSKVKRLHQDLGKLRAANEGDHRAFQHVLDVAYGRKGKLVHELMEPFLITPKSEIPPPMIQGLERSRPPVYSQAFRALLTNPLSRKTKALTLEKIDKPPKLPNRADPDSEDARLLGPLSKRRHVNILWRAYTHEVKYTIPPLDVKLSQQGHSNGEDKLDIPSSPSETASDSMSFGVTLGGFQDAGMVERLRLMAGLGGGNRAMTRRERRALSGPEVSDASLHPSLLPTRQLRRSHRWLLSKIPLLKCVPHKDGPTVKNGKTSYSVYLANEALRNSRFKARQKINPVDHSWIVYGETARRKSITERPLQTPQARQMVEKCART